MRAASAWSRLRDQIIGLRRDNGRALILRGCDKVLRNDPTDNQAEQAIQIIGILHEMLAEEMRRLNAEEKTDG